MEDEEVSFILITLLALLITHSGKSIKQLWQEASERHLEKQRKLILTNSGLITKLTINTLNIQDLDYCRQNEYNSGKLNMQMWNNLLITTTIQICVNTVY